MHFGTSVVRKWSEANPAQPPRQQQPKHFASPEKKKGNVTKRPTTKKKRQLAQPGQQQPKHFCSTKRERESITKNQLIKNEKKDDGLPLGTKKTLAPQHHPSKPVNSRSPTFCSEFHLWNSDLVQTSL